MPSKAPTAFKAKLTGKQRYGDDKIGELRTLYSKGNGYEGRYDFPVTVTYIDKDKE